LRLDDSDGPVLKTDYKTNTGINSF